MNNKRNDPESSLQPAIPFPTLANNGLITPFGSKQPESKEEKWIQHEFQKRVAIMRAEAIEAQYVVDASAYLFMHSLSVFKQSASYILTVKENCEMEELRPYLDKYCKRSIEDLATRQFAINDVATANMAYMVHRDQYPPEFKEESKGWMSRLFNL